MPGERLTGPVDPEKLRFRDGTINLEEVRRITPSLDEAARLLSETSDRVDELDTGLLIGPVSEALGDVKARARPRPSGTRCVAPLPPRVAPAVLGGEGPRRYFLAVQNPAELRGSGRVHRELGDHHRRERQARTSSSSNASAS